MGLGLFFTLLEWIPLLLRCQCFVQGDRHTKRGVKGEAIRPHTSTTKQSAYLKGLRKLENLWLH